MRSCHSGQMLISRCTRHSPSESRQETIFILVIAMSLIRSISTRWWRSNDDVGHGAVMPDSLTEEGVGGRDQARRGQLVECR